VVRASVADSSLDRGLAPRLSAGDSYPLATLLVLCACFQGFVNTFSVFLNSLGLVKIQSIISFAMILPSVLLPIWLSHWLGVPGIALAAAVCNIPGVIIWPIYTRRALRLHLLRV
jgi:Na+-driven multidrug efflux pump